MQNERRYYATEKGWGGYYDVLVILDSRVSPAAFDFQDRIQWPNWERLR